ncbi:MAG: hypothetical protein ACI94Y_004244 [Maribacter sp.]|jgi:hypothetical protein
MSNSSISNNVSINNLSANKIIYLSPIYRFVSLLYYILVFVLFVATFYVDFIIASISIGLIFLFLTARFSHFIWNTKPQITLSEKGIIFHFENDKTYTWQDINDEEVVCHSKASNYFKYDLIFKDSASDKHTYRISYFDIDPTEFEKLISLYKVKFRNDKNTSSFH